MHILTIGVNHRTAPVEIREKIAFEENVLPEAVHALAQQKSIFESVIISTCNRTELYVVSDQLHTGRYYTKAFLAGWFGYPINELEPYLYIKQEDDAVRHLFNVACGLDSLVLGETQILGQVRSFFLKAQESGTTGTLFNELFKEAITLAKRAHAETGINDNPVSVSYAAVELAAKIFGDLSGRHIVIAGAGKMSELTAEHLFSYKDIKLTVLNRTEAKAEALASKFAGKSGHISALADTLRDADIFISSTGSREYILGDSQETKALLKSRNGKPLFMVDIAVPRDIDPGVADHDGVFLYDIDDLEGLVQSNMALREQDAAIIGDMAEEQLGLYNEWIKTLGVVPVISALRQKASKIQRDTMESLERKLPDLSTREKKVISKHTKSIINQMLRDPIHRVKEYPDASNADELIDSFVKIFGIEDEVEAETEKQAGKQMSDNLSVNRKRPALSEAPVTR